MTEWDAFAEAHPLWEFCFYSLFWINLVLAIFLIPATIGRLK